MLVLILKNKYRAFDEDLQKQYKNNNNWEAMYSERQQNHLRVYNHVTIDKRTASGNDIIFSNHFTTKVVLIRKKYNQYFTS